MVEETYPAKELTNYYRGVFRVFHSLTLVATSVSERMLPWALLIESFRLQAASKLGSYIAELCDPSIPEGTLPA